MSRSHIVATEEFSGTRGNHGALVVLARERYYRVYVGELGHGYELDLVIGDIPSQ